MSFKVFMSRWAVENFFKSQLQAFDLCVSAASEDELEALCGVVSECTKALGGMLQVEEYCYKPIAFLAAYLAPEQEDVDA